MNEPYRNAIKGDRTMSQGFIAQYAAEAAMQTPGVARLDQGSVSAFREALGLEPAGQGVQVFFKTEDENAVSITVYPVIEFGQIVPEVAWSIQENVKSDVETFTGLMVEAVNVHVIDVTPPWDESKE